MRDDIGRSYFGVLNSGVRRGSGFEEDKNGEGEEG